MKKIELLPYEISEDETRRLKKEYLLIHKNVDLEAISSEDVPRSSGVYFWLMDYKERQYKIYIGKTKSLQKRVNDYRSNFQIHSPNDFKLRFFQKFMHEEFKDAQLNLYFMPCKEKDCTEKETDAYQAFKPVINERAKTSPEMRQSMQDAFENYYKEMFANKFSMN